MGFFFFDFRDCIFEFCSLHVLITDWNQFFMTVLIHEVVSEDSCCISFVLFGLSYGIVFYMNRISYDLEFWNLK